MSKISATLFPTILITKKSKWRIHQAVTTDLYFNSSIHRKKTHISWSGSNSTNDTIVNKVRNRRKTQTLPCHLNQMLNNVTMAMSTTAPTETMSKLEKMRKGGFWFRKWDSLDVTHLLLISGRHVLALCAPFVFNWEAFFVSMVLWLFSGFGVTIGYHRLLTHRSFKTPKWLEYFFAYCGLHAGQKDPIFWVSVHKNHHKYADTEKDPHSPNEGFWFSHMGWCFYHHYLSVKCGERRGEYSNVPELQAQWFYRFLHKTYVLHSMILATLLYLYGGFPYLAWGMGMRELLVNHFAFLGTSAVHKWGKRPWNTPDTSTNSFLVAMLTLGEGWHNNHHAFPYSARHGLEWWQFDFTWEVIKFLAMVGLATDVKVPTEADKRRKQERNIKGLVTVYKLIH